MNRNDLVSRLQKVSRVQNNRFDISAGRKFTAPAGALIPCYIRELDFGNHISVDVSNLTRTIPMQRANYARYMTQEKVTKDGLRLYARCLTSTWTIYQRLLNQLIRLVI